MNLLGRDESKTIFAAAEDGSIIEIPDNISDNSQENEVNPMMGLDYEQ